jgi:hypothetical protein
VKNFRQKFSLAKIRQLKCSFQHYFSPYLDAGEATVLLPCVGVSSTVLANNECSEPTLVVVSFSSFRLDAAGIGTGTGTVGPPASAAQNMVFFTAKGLR